MIPPGVALDVLIGGNVRRLREDAGLTGAQLAARAGVEADRLADIEDGCCSPTPREMVALRLSLGCGLAEIFDEPRGERMLS